MGSDVGACSDETAIESVWSAAAVSTVVLAGAGAAGGAEGAASSPS